MGGSLAVGLVACVAPELGGLWGGDTCGQLLPPGVCRPADGRDPDGRALPGARVCSSARIVTTALRISWRWSRHPAAPAHRGVRLVLPPPAAIDVGAGDRLAVTGHAC